MIPLLTIYYISRGRGEILAINKYLTGNKNVKGDLKDLKFNVLCTA